MCVDVEVQKMENTQNKQKMARWQSIGHSTSGFPWAGSTRFEAQGRILLADLQTVWITAKPKVTMAVLRLPIICIEAYASTIFLGVNDSHSSGRYFSLKVMTPESCRQLPTQDFFWFSGVGKAPGKRKDLPFRHSSHPNLEEKSAEQLQSFSVLAVEILW